MTNRVSSFPSHNEPAPLHRHGGKITAQAELQVGYLGDDYTLDGSGTVRSLPVLPAGTTATLKLLGSPMFAHSTKLICPGSTNYVGAPGDLVFLRSDGDGVWRVYPITTSYLAAGTGASARATRDRLSDIVSVKDFGAKGDALSIAVTASITSGANALTATSASFAASDIGKGIIVPGAGASGGFLNTTILGFIDATHVTLTANAGTTLTAASKTISYGTDDTAAFNAALAAGNCACVPAGKYWIAGTIVMGAFDTLVGYSKGSTKLYAATANLPLIQLPDGIPEMQISNLALDRLVTAAAGGDGIQCVGGVGLCNLEELWIYRQWRGLALGATDGAWARHIIVSACQNDGLYMTNVFNYAPTQWQLHDIYATNCVGSGFHIQSTEGPPAAGMILGKWSNLQTFANSGYGLLVNGSSTAPVFGVRATNCHFGADGLGTVKLNTFGYGHAFTELVCEFAGTQTTGPTASTAATNSGNGVELTVNNTECRLSGVDIQGCADAGISSSCASLIVDQGYIRSNGANGGGQRYGIVYSAGKVRLSGLTITTAGGVGQTYGLVAGVDTLQMINCDLTGNLNGAVFEAVPLVNSHIIGCFPTSLSSIHPNSMKGFTVGGLVVGAATGGNIGAGTTNVSNGAYKNNTAYINP
jgi:hypothetical protein